MLQNSLHDHLLRGLSMLVAGWALFNTLLARMAGCLTRRLSLIVALSVLAGFAEGDTVNREFQLKAVYLFHFAELAEWPMPLPVTICLQGSSPLREYLPALEGHLINGKAVHVLLDQQTTLADCRILFLSDITVLTDAMSEQAKILHVLLVSDAEGFAERGGMVQIALRDNKLQLVINLPAVKRAGLRLSSKLLRMAEILE
jgi:hypothetical protein